jgi:hypothetical protein
MLDRIRRRARQMKKAHSKRMKLTTEAGPEVVVPGNPKGGEKGPALDFMGEEEDISPEFIKCFTRLKWECPKRESHWMCFSILFQKSPTQTAEGTFVVAPNCHYSPKKEKGTSKKVYHAHG